MRLLILIALAALTFSIRSEARICNLHIQNLEEAIGENTALRSKFEQSLSKKGHALVSEAEVREGDLFIQDAFVINRQGKFLPKGSQDLVESFTSVLMGMGQGQRLVGCEAKNDLTLSQVNTEEKVLMTLEIRFEQRGEKDRGCRSITGKMVQRALEVIAKKIPKCIEI